VVVVAICHGLNIDRTVAISIPIYRYICACSFDKHCVLVESLLSGDLPPLGLGRSHLSVSLWDLVNLKIKRWKKIEWMLKSQIPYDF
jgi:hypothetical protein